MANRKLKFSTASSANAATKTNSPEHNRMIELYQKFQAPQTFNFDDAGAAAGVFPEVRVCVRVYVHVRVGYMLAGGLCELYCKGVLVSCLVQTPLQFRLVLLFASSRPLARDCDNGDQLASLTVPPFISVLALFLCRISPLSPLPLSPLLRTPLRLCPQIKTEYLQGSLVCQSDTII